MKFIIEYLDGRRVKIDAKQIGQFAVHRCFVKDRDTGEIQLIDEYAITHIASNRLVNPWRLTKREALDLAEQLTLHDIDCNTYWGNGCCANDDFYQRLQNVVNDFAKRNFIGQRWRVKRQEGDVC